MTKQYLLEHGVKPNLRGYRYILEAVELVQNVEGLGMMEVYQNIADKHQTTRSKVERAMRYAIQGKVKHNGTVGEFIFCAADGVL